MTRIRSGDAFGIGDAEIDVRGAVLLDGVTVAVVGTADPTGAGRALAVNLEGRVNKSTTRMDVLYLTDVDGAASIVAEILGLVARVGPEFLDLLLARIDELPRRGGST